MVGLPNNHGFFLLKNDHFGVFWGTTIFGNIHMSYGQSLVHGEGTSSSRVGCQSVLQWKKPCTDLPDGIVLGIVLGWAPIGFAAICMKNPARVGVSYERMVLHLGEVFVHTEHEAIEQNHGPFVWTKEQNHTQPIPTVMTFLFRFVLQNRLLSMF